VTVAQAVDGVEAFYKKVSNFKATFRQEVKRKAMPRARKHRGIVYFKKPGMMRWDYTQPEKNYYISDGEVLWSYTPEDRVVYKLPVKDSELYGALKFLFGQGDLRKEFDVSLGAPAADLVTLELRPKVKQSNYKSLTLRVDPKTFEIKQTELVDPLDNVSKVTFAGAVYEELNAKAFKFTPPAGVRVQDLQTGRPSPAPGDAPPATKVTP
jgi:outer membrane lipoprotein carrier protein